MIQCDLLLNTEAQECIETGNEEKVFSEIYSLLRVGPQESLTSKPLQKNLLFWNIKLIWKFEYKGNGCL